MTEALLEPTEWVAHVSVASGLAHLDRPFDYLIPDDMVGRVRVGVRVRVRLAGRACDGIVVAVDHDREPGVRLSPLERLVSKEVVAPEDQLRLARTVADHWAGTLEEVLRWSVPARHATTEAADPPAWPVPSPRMPAGTLRCLGTGADFLRHLAEGGRPRAHWRVAPTCGAGDADALGDWCNGLVQAICACLESGRGALVCLPTVADVELLASRVEQAIGRGTVAVLHAEQAASARWRNYLAVVRGGARVVVGTRSAVMAPLHDIGLVAVWEEASDLHDEQRAPYPNTRDVAALRAQSDRCALLLAGRSCSVRAAAWLESGWLVGITTPRPALRSVCPGVRAPGDSDPALARDPLARDVRIPDLAMTTLREGLRHGPVLVSVPRVGDLLAPSCGRCRTPIRCPRCQGQVVGRRTTTGTELHCTLCGTPLPDWRCPTCGGTTVRSGIVGATTTAAEMGRSFPDVPVVDSSGDHVRRTVDSRPQLVVATPGAEPVAESGYAAAVILDAVPALSRPGLNAVEQVLNGWFSLMALVRATTQEGRVVVVGPPDDRAVQALIRNDPVGWATTELADRRAARFPPATPCALVDGSEEAVAKAAERLAADDTLELLGPVPGPERAGQPSRHRLVVRPVPGAATDLSAAVFRLRAAHTMSRETGSLRVVIDPVGLL